MSDSPSPRVTQSHEKQELQDLNKRLVTYISRVQQLEGENSKLREEVTIVKTDTVLKEVHRIEEAYSSELAEAKLLLETVSQEKSEQEIKHAADVKIGKTGEWEDQAT